MSKVIRSAIITSAIVFFALAAQVLFAYTQMHNVIQLFVAASLCGEAICLLLLKRWAVRAARWYWGVIVALLVLGCLFNPFFWHEFPSNSEPFGLGLPILYAAVSVIGGACWHILRPSHA